MYMKIDEVFLYFHFDLGQLWVFKVLMLLVFLIVFYLEIGDGKER